MVIYEVTATVLPEFVRSYESYMTERHIPDLLETGHFTGAVFAKASDGRYRIQYQARDQASLDDYVKNDADRLRADLAKHFPTGVENSREVWFVQQTWQPD